MFMAYNILKLWCRVHIIFIDCVINYKITLLCPLSFSTFVKEIQKQTLKIYSP
jgi:hypothetical protein